MALNFNWSITKLDRNLSDGIVETAHYTFDATDGAYASSCYGSVGLETPGENDSVIPYSELTEKTVIGWVKDKLGGAETVAEIEEALVKRIEEQRTPTKGSGLPWS